MMIAVVATGNHFWVDGFVGASLCLGAVLLVQRWFPLTDESRPFKGVPQRAVEVEAADEAGRGEPAGVSGLLPPFLGEDLRLRFKPPHGFSRIGSGATIAALDRAGTGHRRLSRGKI